MKTAICYCFSFHRAIESVDFAFTYLKIFRGWKLLWLAVAAFFSLPLSKLVMWSLFLKLQFNFWTMLLKWIDSSIVLESFFDYVRFRRHRGLTHRFKVFFWKLNMVDFVFAFDECWIDVMTKIIAFFLFVLVIIGWRTSRKGK